MSLREWKPEAEHPLYVLVHWTENDHLDSENVMMKWREFLDLIARIRDDEERNGVPGYCKVKYTAIYRNGNTYGPCRADVQPDYGAAQVGERLHRAP